MKAGLGVRVEEFPIAKDTFKGDTGDVWGLCI